MNETIARAAVKAETELGYDPKVAREEGMRRSIASVLERGPISPCDAKTRILRRTRTPP
jgi:hypothetical protein